MNPTTPTEAAPRNTTEGWQLGHWTQLLSGIAFTPLAPAVDSIHIRDIAHSLGMQCRYNGHVRRYYSVAEHCVLMSDWVLENEIAADGLTVEQTALWALLHDAPEAYIGDMVRPLKLAMPEFREADDRIMAVIAERFNLPGGTRTTLSDGTTGLTLPAAVKEIDTRILLDERAALLAVSDRPWATGDLDPLGVTIRAWDPGVAKWEYLVRFRTLTGRDI